MKHHLPILRKALSGDAHELHSLMVSAFDPSILRYTVFQSPRAVVHMREVIARCEGSLDKVTVATRDGKVVGYCHAVHREDAYLLNYIAVARECQGHGTGAQLLDHYENQGAGLGYTRLELSVFEKNERAVLWYTSRGYVPAGSGYWQRLDMAGLRKCQGPTLSYDAKSMATALAQERSKGFAKVECRVGRGDVTVGLIAGHTCRLLEFSGVHPWEAITSIGCAFPATRQSLIALLESPLRLGPILDTQRLIHMRKSRLPHQRSTAGWTELG